ncbi:MAG: hypothetical protein Q7T18_09395, partial [Sedimentisphaerales bacterium]|nr:hypothetical protein [Sedimentisphaerales bacterium]
MTIKFKTFVTACLLASNIVYAGAAAPNDPYDAGWIGVTWDLSRDWSETKNPNGSWVYGKAAPFYLWMGPIEKVRTGWHPTTMPVGDMPAGQRVWADTETEPAWGKCIEDFNSNKFCLKKDDVFTLGSQVHWISPVSAKIRVSGRFWNGQKTEDVTTKIEAMLVTRGSYFLSSDFGLDRLGAVTGKNGCDNSVNFDRTIFVRPGQKIAFYVFTPLSFAEVPYLIGCELKIEVLEIIPKVEIKGDANKGTRPNGKGVATVTVTDKDELLEFQFKSDRMVYVERLVDDSLKGVYWSCDGVNTYYDRWVTSDAFELSILTDPQQKEPTKVDKNWRLVWAGEVGKDAGSARHYVMELVNTKDPVRLKIHTVLDGTSVMTRWLEIGNTFDKPIALTTVCPWMGNTWPYPDKYIL